MTHCIFCGSKLNLTKGIASVYVSLHEKISFCWTCNLDGKIEEYLDRLEDAKYNSMHENANYS